jgi:hypothetical protein
MDRGRDPSNQEASTKRKLGETVEKIEIDMVSTSKWDTSKRPTPRRAWAVGVSGWPIGRGTSRLREPATQPPGGRPRGQR